MKYKLKTAERTKAFVLEEGVAGMAGSYAEALYISAGAGSARELVAGHITGRGSGQDAFPRSSMGTISLDVVPTTVNSRTARVRTAGATLPGGKKERGGGDLFGRRGIRARWEPLALSRTAGSFLWASKEKDATSAGR